MSLISSAAGSGGSAGDHLEIIPFERAHSRALGRVLSEAFIDDPVWTAIGPRNRSHRRISNRASFAGILAGARRHRARIRVARLDGRLVGGTIAFDSESWPMPDRAALWETGWFLLAGPAPALRGFRDDVAMKSVHVSHPHTYLWFIAVDPRLHGRGVGRRLIAELHEHSDPFGLPVYLETATESNVSFYNSLGYVMEGEIELPSGPTMWRMERPAPSPL